MFISVEHLDITHLLSDLSLSFIIFNFQMFIYTCTQRHNWCMPRRRKFGGCLKFCLPHYNFLLLFLQMLDLIGLLSQFLKVKSEIINIRSLVFFSKQPCKFSPMYCFNSIPQILISCIFVFIYFKILSNNFFEIFFDSWHIQQCATLFPNI